MSHPTWVRGLKSRGDKYLSDKNVAPYLGAWIEIDGITVLETYKGYVAPYLGAWIEIIDEFANLQNELESHPTWVRGLKSTPLVPNVVIGLGRTLPGCVD